MNHDERKSRLSAEKQNLLRALLRVEKSSSSFSSEIQVANREGDLPVSSAQKRLWFLEQLYPHHPFYNIPLLFRIRGRISETALQQSIQEIIQRHEILRTTFSEEEGDPVQVIAEELPFKMEILEIEKDSLIQMEERAMELLFEEAQLPFNLVTGPLIRAKLIRLSEEDHFFMINIHHIVADGWSMGVLYQELETLYETYLTGNSSPLPELQIQYADYTLWQNEWFEGEEMQRQLSYWKKKLSGELPVLQLPWDFSRPNRQSFRGKSITFIIPERLTSSLRKLSQREGTSLYMTLLTAFKTLLYRYTGQEDLIVGLPIANRRLQETEALIGFFVNTLLLRSFPSDKMTFLDFLRQIQEDTVEAYANQDVPYEKVVESIQPDRDLSRASIFQVLFNFASTPDLKLKDVLVEPYDIDNHTAKFDLEVLLQEDSDHMIGLVEYSTDLFKEETISRIFDHYLVLLNSIAEDPNQSLSQLKMMTEPEVRQVIVEWNQTVTDDLSEKCLHHIFEEQAEKTPDKKAIIFKGDALTYRELNAMANGLAQQLRERGVGPDVPVGICMERSLEMIIGVLGVLKAGGGYVPLDPNFPEDRLSYILEDSNAPVILTQSSFQALLQKTKGEQILCDYLQEITPIERNPDADVSPENLMYVIYTSGSTGKPKGIAMDHRPLVNLILWQNKNLLSPEANVLQFSTLNFDMSCHEIFATFNNGGTLVLVDERTRKDPEALFGLILDEKINRVHLPYIAFQQLAEVADQFDQNQCKLQEITVSGEQFRITPQIKNWISQLEGCRIQNHYGPSETHVVTSYMIDHLAQEENPLPPIGKPIDNTEVYILDSQLKPVPVGVPGELYIGGICLARGYLNRDDLTHERFILDPFSNSPNARLYKTGDLARFLSDGNIDYLGRIDDQLKIRGYRVEPGEVESVINKFPGVQETVVVGHEESNQAFLAAYIVADQRLDQDHLTAYLKEQIPEYMIPTVFTQIESLPLTPSGKVSRRSLPKPERNLLTRNKTEPETEMEKQIAAIWAEVLNYEQIAKEDHFFELGGHSLLATKVISRIRSSFNRDFPLHWIFDYPRLSELTARIESHLQKEVNGEAGRVSPVPRKEFMPLSYAQERIWFFEQLQPELTAYNLSFSVKIQGELDIHALEKSYQQIIGRHEVLRSTFPSNNGKPVQVIQSPTPYGIEVVDLRHIKSGKCEQQARNLANQEVDKPFDLTQGPLIRAVLYQLGEQKWLLLFIMHHIVSDGWSMSNFSEELFKGYQKNLTGDSYLPHMPLQYVDYAVWQRNWLQEKVLTKQMDYWKRQLEGSLPLLQLPMDRSRPAVQSHRGASIHFTLDRQLTKSVHRFCQKEDVSLYMTLLTAFKVLLYRYTGEEDVLVGTPVANRSREEWEPIIGFFVNTLVIRTRPQEKLTWREYLKQVRSVSLEAFEHQDIPFEKLVNELQPQRDLGYSPLFQVMFLLQSMPSEPSYPSSIDVESVQLDSQTSLFDLTLEIEEIKGELRGMVEYSTDLFDEDTILRFIGHYEQLLRGMLEDPNQQISRTPLLTEQERQLLLTDWNQNAESIPDHPGLVHDLFENAVARYQDQIAVVDGESTYTYHDLNKKADQIAFLLRQNKVGPGTIIGVYQKRSIDLIASFLGVLKAGANFVPLDPSYPMERITWMIKDTCTPVILTQTELADRLPNYGFETVLVDQVSTTSIEINSEELTVGVTPDDLAYIIYTSGSTGKPKGVMIRHRSLVNFIYSYVGRRRLNSSDRVTQFASISFDMAMAEIFPTLVQGATLVLRPESILAANDFMNWIHREQASVINLPTAYWHYLVNELEVGKDVFPDSVRLVDIGGEKASMSVYKKWTQLTKGAIHFINGYGPTETTVSVCNYSGQADPLDECTEIPIGRVYPNVELYVLDHHRQPVPIGVSGELYIGGIALAIGYLHLPDVTAQKFVPHPFKAGERLYRTGDRVRYRKDGQLEYIERIDSQVKIRGFRIELGEVEATLEQHPDVQQALVTVREDLIPGQKHLVAYLKGENRSGSVESVRKFLKETLPDYMMPASFVHIQDFPLTPGGKIDRNLLPKPQAPQMLNENEQPRNPVEERLASIWKEVLNREQIGIHQNFLEIGGHSLLATQVMSRIHNEFSIDLPLQVIFESPTIAELSSIILPQEGSGKKPPMKKISRVPRKVRS
ncbi:amino acid adenylation domain-containing protein [Kroppenstedtia pulmonis]|uniref:Amino acid adenylation domain-containing protein n=1 Tax=Kroppenstedtia pulmonis TaxID=1380685 RepID=A0A7D4CN69_9BACL|nr:non-ribosomal peptide synthetase [Kroppenstedtia pulmonis]QKG84618.1 amino acid adenylation domain-containing protein [Kroppenstedtia pulmonis]